MIPYEELKFKQSLDLDMKIKLTRERIIDWYQYWNGLVHVSYSGGRQSTALLHLVRTIFPEVPGVFCNTGLEYPEIFQFVKKTDNIIWLKPKMPFPKVIEKYGYPVTTKENAQKLHEIRTTKSLYLLLLRLYGKDNKYKSYKLPEKWKPLINAPFKVSHKCCDVMKKRIPRPPYVCDAHRMTGELAGDSHLRKQKYLRFGCNAYEKGGSTPIAFWTEQDTVDYLDEYKVPYSSIYDMGYQHTGCMFCMFGVHLEKHPNKFQLMKQTHPKLWNYCIDKLGCGEVLDYIKVPYE